MTTANEILTGAFGKAGIFQPEDTIPAEDTTVALAVLNDYLNGLNARGAVFPSVTLTINQSVPVADQNVGDLKWAMAAQLASQWGKQMIQQDAIMAMQADRRFVAAHTVIYGATPDAGLRHMPSTRRPF